MEWYEEVSLRVAEEFDCAHDESIPVKFTKANGAVCVRIQCRRCGDNRGERKKAGYCIDQLPDWDESLRREWSRRRGERRDELRNEHIDEIAKARRPNLDDWWDSYNKYLHSPQWHKMRTKVLERDADLCQACLTNKATHVHHLSYDLFNQLGKSAAFELVAICRSCHEQIHPHMSEAQDRLTLYNPYLNGATNGQHR